MSDFPSRLKQLRHGRKLTQVELAQQIGISKSTVNMYEHGEREPGLSTLCTLADYFYVDADYLLGRTECVAAQQANLYRAIQSYRDILDDLQSAQHLFNRVLCRVFTTTDCGPAYGNSPAGFTSCNSPEDFHLYFRTLLAPMSETERHDFRRKMLFAIDTVHRELSCAEALPDEPSQPGMSAAPLPEAR